MITDIFEQRQWQIVDALDALQTKVEGLPFMRMYGKLTSALGTIAVAHLPGLKVGDLCQIVDRDNKIDLYAEVVAINQAEVKLLPYGDIRGLSSNCLISKFSDGFTIKVGDYLPGKMVDGFGNILLNLNKDNTESSTNDGIDCDIKAKAPNPMDRPVISSIITTGVKAIDMFIPLGHGQRVAIFAPPGIGKTTLMGMILRNIDADIIVVGLIGERGREINEFIELELDEKTRNKTIIVASTSDKPPVELVKSAYVAQTIAEYFRNQGKNVVLFIDSITRFARAQREIGLSSGEPATRGGFPPSVFLSFPALMERAGATTIGSITAFYTVLLETDHPEDDPIAGEVKSIVDGHIILSRKLAEVGHYPAIDVLKSLSRIGDRLITDKQTQTSRHIRLLLSKYQELEFLLKVGEYKHGNDKVGDEAIQKNAAIRKLLQQEIHYNADFNKTLQELQKLANEKLHVTTTANEKTAAHIPNAFTAKP